MNRILPLLHYQQSQSGRCLPACARMVLAYIGLQFSEDELSRVLGTTDFGTPAFAITQLAKLKVRVDYRVWSVAQLSLTLENDRPVIAFVQTQFLDYWQSDAQHAVVLVGVEPHQRIWVHDPDLPDGPTPVSWDGFLAAWFEFDQRGATIQR